MTGVGGGGKMTTPLTPTLFTWANGFQSVEWSQVQSYARVQWDYGPREENEGPVEIILVFLGTNSVVICKSRLLWHGKRKIYNIELYDNHVRLLKVAFLFLLLKEKKRKEERRGYSTSPFEFRKMVNCSVFFYGF